MPSFLQIDDLLRLRVPTAVAWSPDGKRLALTIEQQQPELEGTHSHLHVYTLRDRRLRAYTSGARRDAQPIWSPDGQWIHLRSVIDGQACLTRIPADGGAEETLLHERAHVASYDLSADGRWLVCALRRLDPEGPVIARRITRADYKEDGLGFRPADRWGIHLLDLRTGGALRRLSAPRHDAFDPAFAPNSREIAYCANRHRRDDIYSEHQELMLHSLPSGRSRVVPTPTGPVAKPSWSPDGKSIAYVGHDRPSEPWDVVNRHVWLVGRRGGARDLMPRWDRSVADGTVGDVGVYPLRRGARWSRDGKRLYFLASDRGRTQIFSVARSGRAQPRAEQPAKAHVKAFDLFKAQIACVRADLNNPGELRVGPRAVSKLNDFLRRERELARVSEHWIDCDDGERIQGWLYRPPQRTRRRLPAILSIHGGPVAQYGHSFLHELHWLSAQGYLILACNPRGGLGRGEAFARSIAGDWGNRDYLDLLNATDWLCAQPGVDAQRLGVMGGSYGGYMTNWMVGHTRRFRAAVAQRSVSDLRSVTGSSDIGQSWGHEFGSSFWEDPEEHERMSPINYVERIRTPLLLIHSLADLRCGAEQAEAMFKALRVLGRQVEMVLFPEESHDLSRSGGFARRAARLAAIRDWFQRHL